MISGDLTNILRIRLILEIISKRSTVEICLSVLAMTFLMRLTMKLSKGVSHEVLFYRGFLWGSSPKLELLNQNFFFSKLSYLLECFSFARLDAKLGDLSSSRISTDKARLI